MTLAQLSPTEWEGASDACDFHVRLEDGEYMVDVFDRFIKSDADEAHLASHQCDSLDDAVAYCRGFEVTNG